MSMDIKEIEQLNIKAKELNKIRNQKLGQLEALKSQFNVALKEYNATYGTDLQAEGIKDEIKRVEEDLNQEVVKLREQISLVESN